jgi:hypothetical protein
VRGKSFKVGSGIIDMLTHGYGKHIIEERSSIINQICIHVQTFSMIEIKKLVRSCYGEPGISETINM